MGIFGPVCTSDSAGSKSSRNHANDNAEKTPTSQYFKLGLFHFTLVILSLPGIVWYAVKMPPRVQTVGLALALHHIYALGITAGYHRLWTHRSYEACTALRYFLVLLACGQFQYDIIWWARHHRSHHRYVDTPKDPYNIKEGFFHAHVGWLISYSPDSWGEVEISDVERDPVARWQKRYFYLLFAIMSIAIPTSICHFCWQDLRGGLFFASFARIIFNYHITALINSWSHWSGSQPYTEKITARNTSPILGFFTAGEAYHNFHHRFPSDYRNGIRWFDVDASKWFISLCEKLRLASKLIRTSKSDIELSKMQAQGTGFIGPEVQKDHKSPAITWEDYEQMCRTGRCLISISGRVYDITTFMFDHPGGRETLQQAIGTEAKDAFNSVDHSPYAQSILASLHIALIDCKQDYY